MSEVKYSVGARVSGTMVWVSDESTKLKLDRGREGVGIDQEVDEYKTESKV